MKEKEERQAAERKKVIKLAKTAVKDKPPVLPSHNLVSRPYLPPYKDEEDIATFLTRFERVAKMLILSRDTFAVRLACLLTGKAAELYKSFPSSTTKDYKLLKQALLTGFSKTPDDYRVDYRSTKIKVGQNQLSRMFDPCVESSSVADVHADLRECIIFDQFMSSLSPKLRLFIKERRPAKLKETIQLVDYWASAHKAYP